MPFKLSTIGFDADDTLWENERFFKQTQARFAELMADYAEPAALNARLLATETRNIKRYGFGIKGFVLSMVETAIDVTDGRVPGQIIGDILESGQEMLAHPVELMPYARETVEALACNYELFLITKGDLLDQERKLASSGLAELFDRVEIVSAKLPETYARIFAGRQEGEAMMVGNSMKSDVLPALEVGAWGVFVPQSLTWELEHAESPSAQSRYREIVDLRELPELVLEVG